MSKVNKVNENMSSELSSKLSKSKTEVTSTYKREFPIEPNEDPKAYEIRIDKMVSNYFANANVNNSTTGSIGEVKAVMTKDKLIETVLNIGKPNRKVLKTIKVKNIKK